MPPRPPFCCASATCAVSAIIGKTTPMSHAPAASAVASTNRRPPRATQRSLSIVERTWFPSRPPKRRASECVADRHELPPRPRNGGQADTTIVLRSVVHRGTRSTRDARGALRATRGISDSRECRSRRWLGAVENTANIDSDLVVEFGDTGSVAHQARRPIDQIRIGDQRQDRESASAHFACDSARARRRGDRARTWRKRPRCLLLAGSRAWRSVYPTRSEVMRTCRQHRLSAAHFGHCVCIATIETL